MKTSKEKKMVMISLYNDKSPGMKVRGRSDKENKKNQGTTTPETHKQ